MGGPFAIERGKTAEKLKNEPMRTFNIMWLEELFWYIKVEQVT
jgi:hypothetical protein